MQIMRVLAVAATALSALGANSSIAHATCPPANYSRAQLDGLKAAKWLIADDSARNALARALTDCLTSPDPALRDGIAYEALFHFLRARLLTDGTMLSLQDDLEVRLTAPEGAGFERPFAALALAEIARADRIKTFLTPQRRARLLTAGVTYLTGVRDYRGFDDREGWRHGIAHGADLMLQLALNPAFAKPDLQRICDAIALQISPPSHSYIFGEPQRLAAPILQIAQRNLFSQAEWSAWLEQVAAPAPLASWNDAYASTANLARLHNVDAFMQTLYLNARLNKSADDDTLLPGAEAAIRALP
ncbi:MAG: DUF2785 domain-containing protein [Alphaproteobacteria bacterium]|nr:DUF2785 domain-containing protein [Alphaproteobacteria bacterium]